MIVEKLALLALAVVLIIGASTNRIFFFGRMGGVARADVLCQLGSQD
jgi:hypothetical protein